MSRPLPLKAKTLPVAGSTAGDAQAMRCGGTSLVKMLYLCSHSSLPVSALKHISRSCMRLAGAGRVLQVQPIAEDHGAGPPAVRAPSTPGSRRSATTPRAGPSRPRRPFARDRAIPASPSR